MSEGLQIFLAIIGVVSTLVGGPYLWRWLMSRGEDSRESATLSHELQTTQTNNIIQQWQTLATVSRERADALEVRVENLESQRQEDRNRYEEALRIERERHEKIEAAQREQLRVATQRALDAERRAAVAEKQAEELLLRVDTLEAYVKTHAQISVAAIQKGLMRALAERAPSGVVDAIVADVVANISKSE